MKLKFFLVVVAIFSPLIAAAQTGGLITAFTNPVPSSFAEFGWSIAAVGHDRVLIGAPADDTGAENSGAAYLFKTNGVLLTAFTNPAPSTGVEFGEALAMIGDERVLIGTLWAEAAYLFDTNARLLTTFTNPFPASAVSFGCSVAALDSGRVLIGAEGYELRIKNSGAAFLFNTNGTLSMTITNPSPGDHLFGHSVAVIFKDKLAIGAPHTDSTQVNAGAVYLFNTNGVLLMTFTNPNPVSFDNFGWSVTALGNDRVLISGQNSSGVVYLFDTNGVLLTSFSGPSSDPSSGFGASVAVVDENQVLIGAPADDVWTRAGTAFLFNTNANLLADFKNPTTSQYSNQYLQFGGALAILSSDSVIVGSPSDNTGGLETGAAYLFSIPPPLLQIQMTTTNQVAVSWLSPAPRCVLQENTNDIQTPNWSDVTNGIQDNGTNHLFIVAPLGNAFFRLFRP